jgi:hypothetical protein
VNRTAPNYAEALLKPREPELLDALFLSVGRALHLANAYEDKCQYVLRIGNLITAHQGDAAMTFEEAVASVPADKLLGGTLHGLASHAMSRTMDMDTLHKARQARNWIAHEGASIGGIWSRSGATAWLNHTTRRPRTGSTATPTPSTPGSSAISVACCPSKPRAPQARSNSQDPVVATLMQVKMPPPSAWRLSNETLSTTGRYDDGSMLAD